MAAMGRPETDWARRLAMTQLGNGLSDVDHHEDALVVQEAELSMERRLGASEHHVLITQGNIAVTYEHLGRHEEALRMRQEVYSGFLKLHGEENERTFQAALNYAISLGDLRRFEEAKSLLYKTVPVAQRVYSESHEITLKMRSVYAHALCRDTSATLEDLREAVATLEESARIARRVLGSAHPVTEGIEGALQNARVVLRARETPPPNTS